MTSRRCLRCHGRLTADGRAGWLLTFWTCEPCGRRYAKQWRTLTDAWLSPLSIALYYVIYEKRPEGHAIRIARAIQRERPELVPLLVQDIREEVAQHRQKVRQILPRTRASERDLRSFLSSVANELETLPPYR